MITVGFVMYTKRVRVEKSFFSALVIL